MNLLERVERLERRAEKLLKNPAKQVAPIRLRKPAEIVVVLEEQMNAVRGARGLDQLETAREVRSLAQLSLRAMESEADGGDSGANMLNGLSE